MNIHRICSWFLVAPITRNIFPQPPKSALTVTPQDRRDVDLQGPALLGLEPGRSVCSSERWNCLFSFPPWTVIARISSSPWHKVKRMQTKPLPQRTSFLDFKLVKYSAGLLSILHIHGVFDTPKWEQSKSHNNWEFFWAEEMLVDKFPWF